MTKTLRQVTNELTPAQKRKVRSRAKTLIAEEMTLRSLRKRLEHTQVDVAEAMGIGQDTVSRLETRSNITLATLHRYINAIGGELSILAEFPDRPTVKLTFADLGNDADDDGR